MLEVIGTVTQCGHCDSPNLKIWTGPWKETNYTVTTFVCKDCHLWTVQRKPKTASLDSWFT